jgi:hypothetical protein
LRENVKLQRSLPALGSEPPAVQSLARLPAAAGIAGVLLALLLGLVACRGDSAADPYALYRPALKSEFQAEFDHMDQAPRYALEITVNPTLTLLSGAAEILVTNYSPDAWRYLVFRLYPALHQYGGEMAIQGVAVENRPAPFIYQAENTAVRVDLTEPLPPGDHVAVRFGWNLTLPLWEDNPGVYALFGTSQQMTSLPLFYPALAVYQPDPALGSGSWWLDRGIVRGDAAFNVASLFVVTATLPSEQVVLASGALVSSATVDDVYTRYVWVSGPVREFFLHMSPLFQSTEFETYGTRVVSHWLPGQEVTGRAALQAAVASLRIYSDYYGPYPFRELHVAPAPLGYRGMEYPLVSLMGVEVYTRFQNNMEILVAHEMAHQWWYQIVHNDPVNAPWLDEALSEYSVKLYFEKLYGAADAALLQAQRWETPVELLAVRDEDVSINRPVDLFDNSTQYEAVVYGKGALLYDRIRAVLGDRRFKRFLHDYLEAHRWGIADTADWRAALDALQLPELDSLFREWVGEATPRPTPTVAPTATDEE